MLVPFHQSNHDATNLASNEGEKFTFSINWWYNINYRQDGGRSGYELFEKKEINYMYCAHPRMAVYNDVEGWQNMQFWEQENLHCLREF
jgi:hypothetical protein